MSSSSRFRLLTKLLALVLGVTLIAAACGSDDDDGDGASTTTAATEEMADEEMADDEMAEESGTIVDVAVDSGEFPTLVAALEATGLDEVLAGDGPFTVFAPTEEAFAAAFEALDVTPEELLADTETLESVLTYHVVAGEVPSSDVVTLDGEAVETVNGATVEISVDGESVMVNDANVVAVDIAASNGVIHVIDAVLLPPA